MREAHRFRGVAAARHRGCLVRLLLLLMVVNGVAGCGGAPPKPPSPQVAPAADRPKPSEPPPAAKRGGAYYLDDGPGDNPPANLDTIPDAVPRVEALHPAANRPYEVFGRTYAPLTAVKPYREKGMASWYGRRYHGKPTSSGEIYDMYGMTAAHPTLPIPSYVRVTNLKTNRAVVVRVNDRGPFLHDRVIDLSYVAAYKIGTLASGSGLVQVDLIVPGREATGKNYAALANQGPDAQRSAAASAPTPAPRESAPVPAPPVPKADTPSPKPGPTIVGTRGASSEQAVMKEVVGSGGYFLQLGAFSGKENAEGFVARMKGLATELTDSLQVFARDGLYRVQSGPYATDMEARSAADRLASRLGVKALVTTR